MVHRSPLGRLVGEWGAFLQLRGHSLRGHRRDPSILRSRNGRISYRWLFLYSDHTTRALTPIERERIQRQRRAGRVAGEQVFVVVKFERPFAKVVVLPASAIAELRRLRADKGGISWER
jgi:hypothetical protein